MDRRTFVSAGVATTTAAVLGARAASAGPREQPRWRDPRGESPGVVVLLTLEDVSTHQIRRAVEFGIAPNLGSLVGTHYTNCRSAATACKAARAAISTGKWPHKTGFRSNQGQFLDMPELACDYHVAKIVADAGFPTMQIGKGLHVVRPRLNLAPIFGGGNVIDPKGRAHKADYYESAGYSVSRLGEGKRAIAWGTGPVDEHADELVRSECEEYIPEDEGFVWVGMHAPHSPWVCTEDFLESVPRALLDDHMAEVESVDETMIEVGPSELYALADEQGLVEEIIRHYYGAIAQLDAEVGKLIEEIEDATWIITADHGLHMGEQKLLGKKNTVHPSSTDVPLIVSKPTDRAIVVNEGLVSHIDIAPTILQWFGIEQPAWMEGIPLSEESTPGRAVWTTSPNDLVIATGAERVSIHNNGEVVAYNGAAWPF